MQVLIQEAKRAALPPWNWGRGAWEEPNIYSGHARAFRCYPIRSVSYTHFTDGETEALSSCHMPTLPSTWGSWDLNPFPLRYPCCPPESSAGHPAII